VSQRGCMSGQHGSLFHTAGLSVRDQCNDNRYRLVYNAYARVTITIRSHYVLDLAASYQCGAAFTVERIAASQRIDATSGELIIPGSRL